MLAASEEKAFNCFQPGVVSAPKLNSPEIRNRRRALLPKAHPEAYLSMTIFQPDFVFPQSNFSSYSVPKFRLESAFGSATNRLAARYICILTEPRTNEGQWLTKPAQTVQQKELDTPMRELVKDLPEVNFLGL